MTSDSLLQFILITPQHLSVDESKHCYDFLFFLIYNSLKRLSFLYINGEKVNVFVTYFRDDRDKFLFGNVLCGK